MSAELNIPEEAIEAARDAAIRQQSTRASVKAAAPLIVAAELQRLMDEAFPDGEDSDYHYGCELLLDLVRDRISELRGDRKAERVADDAHVWVAREHSDDRIRSVPMGTRSEVQEWLDGQLDDIDARPVLIKAGEYRTQSDRFTRRADRERAEVDLARAVADRKAEQR